MPAIADNSALLIINSGSSSLKFLLTPATTQTQAAAPTAESYHYRGQVSAIGGNAHFVVSDGDGQQILSQDVSAADHAQAIRLLLDWLATAAGASELVAVGHRVVHGGSQFHQPVVISDEVFDALHELIPLAPNHQPASLLCIKELRRLQPQTIQIACFDTAFHHSRPDVEQNFALPPIAELAQVRRYGFHGLSYEYIASMLPDHLGNKAEGKIIVAHLGHGASLCAMQGRRSVATTMTFTPLDGIPMGTRCGSIDPAVVLYLQQQGMSLQAVSDLLYFQSGLLGVSGSSDDMAHLLELTSPRAKQAIEQFVHHTVRAIGSLAAALEGLDALIFTGGIGEHSASIRDAICRRCQWLGLKLDDDSNNAASEHQHQRISHDSSAIEAWVMRTNEERMIAQHSLHLLHQHQPESTT